MTSGTAAAASPLDVNVASAVAVGAAAGLIGGLFGVGGGIVIVPALMAWSGLERRRANGTSLAATLPIAAASCITYAANGHVDVPVAVILSVGAIGGSALGAELLTKIPRTPLIILFVMTILATAVRLLTSSETAGRGDLTWFTIAEFVVVGFVTGLLAGLLGIGGGVVMVPAMVVLLLMTPVAAKGTSTAVIVPSAIMGTMRNRANGNVDLRIAAVVGGTGIALAVVGSLISTVISDAVSNALFGVLLIVIAATQIRSLVRGVD
ncbi:MAG: sulfite exporter TauE/SafE family protein [Actinomycetota bacterium]